jgi:hypothetical protein
MLSVFLSVEELESLVIPYCHVFENHLHFLPLLLICSSTSSYIIKAWFQSFVISSSPTCIPSLLLPLLPQIFFYFLNRTYTETPLQVEVHEIIFSPSNHSHETDSEQESCVFFTPAMQSVIFRMCNA